MVSRTRFIASCSCAGRARRVRAPAFGAALSQSPGAHRRALRRGQRHRHHGAHHRRGPARALGQPFIVDNKPGASAQIGAEHRRQVAARRLHAVRDDQHVALGQSVPVQEAQLRPGQGLHAGREHHAHPGDHRRRSEAAGASTLAELVAYAKANPGKVSFGYGNSIGQVVGASFAKRTGHRGHHRAVQEHAAGDDRRRSAARSATRCRHGVRAVVREERPGARARRVEQEALAADAGPAGDVGNAGARRASRSSPGSRMFAPAKHARRTSSTSSTPSCARRSTSRRSRTRSPASRPKPRRARRRSSPSS